MPFYTRCRYCKLGVRVPDKALGASVKCPKCAAWYTATPEQEPERAGTRSSGSSPVSSSSPLAPRAAEGGAGSAVAEPPDRPSTGTPLLIESFDPPDDSPDEHTSHVETPLSAPQSEQSNPPLLGIAACLLAAAALICAGWLSTTILTRSLAGVGLGLGILGAVLVGSGKPMRQILPVGGAILSALVLIAAFFIPSLLGPRYEASRQKSTYDPEAIRVIPLKIAPGATEGLESDGYADASRAAIQQGFIRVQVMDATIAPIQVVDAKKRFTKQSFLAITVRIQHLGNGPQVRFVHWGAIGARTAPPATATADGRTLAVADVGRDVPVGITYGYDLHPGRFVDDLLVFEAPSGASAVRLELPGEAWGGRGAFKFQIPSSMLATQPGKKPR